MTPTPTTPGGTATGMNATPGTRPGRPDPTGRDRTGGARRGRGTEACGLGALRRGAPLERILRDARNGALMPPSSDVSADVLGVAALGLDVASSQIAPW